MRIEDTAGCLSYELNGLYCGHYAYIQPMVKGSFCYCTDGHRALFAGSKLSKPVLEECKPLLGQLVCDIIHYHLTPSPGM